MNRPAGPREADSAFLPPGAAASAAVDARGVVTAWSQGAEELLGYRAEEVVGRPAAGMLADDVSAPARRCLAGPWGWSGDLALRHRDGGAVLRTSVRAFPFLDRAGDLQWFLVAAPEDSAMVEWAIADSPLTLAIYDLDARILRMNAATRRLLGVAGEEVLGQPVGEVYERALAGREPSASAFSDSVVAEVLRVGRTGETLRYEVSAPTPGDPRRTTWAVNMSPVRDAAGRVRGVFTAGSDITEQFLARERLALLNEASTRIGTTLDVMRTAQELADVMIPRLADFVSVDLIEVKENGGEAPGAPHSRPVGPLTLRRVAHQSVLEGIPEVVVPLGEVDTYPEYSPPARCLASDEPVLSGLDDPGFVRWVREFPPRGERVRTHGFHSLIAVPLRARGTTLGVAVLVRSRPEAFERDDLLLAEELSARAAVSVDNARRYTREHTTALTLQRSLLPRRLPRPAAVEVASRYLPTATQAGIGGDWFDVIPLSGTRVAFVVGDVVGHGIHASATMGRLRTAVRTLADVDLRPDELLTHLDDLVARLDENDAVDPMGSTTGGFGATCLYAVYDPVSGHCVLASAGHPLPVVIAPGGDVRFVEVSPGPPLGVGGLPFEAAEVALPEGGLIALYTDGLVESHERGFDEGLRLLAGVLAGSTGTLEETCDHVIRSMLPDRPQDDAALLIARTRVLDTEHVATLDLEPDPSQVAYAREAATGKLESWELGEAAFITELVVSELVTNAIRHGSPPIQLRLIRGETSIICEVSDTSSTAPHMRRARTLDEGGRGLLLVAQLTQRWGSRQTASGKIIWAEQDLAADATGAWLGG